MRNIKRFVASVVSVVAVAGGAIGVVASEAKALTRSEVNFLGNVRDAVNDAGYGFVLSGLSSESLIDLAYTACDALDNGSTIEQISNALVSSSVQNSSSAYSLEAGSYIMGMTVASGVQYFCPQHYYQITSYVEQRESFNTAYYAPIRSEHPASTNRSATAPATGWWATLTASDPGSQINVRSTPSLDASSPHYGVAGDRVWVTRSERHGAYEWHFVGFPGSGASGWVRGDFVRLDVAD